MKKSIAGLLTILGIIFVIIGVLGAFGILGLGTFTWISLVFGLIFFPSGISLMKATKSA